MHPTSGDIATNPGPTNCVNGTLTMHVLPKCQKSEIDLLG